MPGGFIITEHAVHRFQQRVVPQLAFSAADALLKRRVKSAKPAGEKTLAGETYWRITAPDAVLVTKSENKQVIVVTVVEPEKLGTEDDPDADLVVEYYRREQAMNRATCKLDEARKNYERRVKAAKNEYQQAVASVLKDCTPDVRECLERSGVAAVVKEDRT